MSKGKSGMQGIGKTRAGKEMKKAGHISEAEYIKELEQRIIDEAPPPGTNPLVQDLGSENGKAGCPKEFAKLPISAKTKDGLAKAGYVTMKVFAPAPHPYNQQRGNLVLSHGTAKFPWRHPPLTRRCMGSQDIQRAAIGHILAGRDLLGAAKTGSGKTLAFLIPTMERLYRLRWTQMDGLGALIISPTRELAIQIFQVLRKIGPKHELSGGLVIGGKDLEEEQERISGMNILVATPGRVLQVPSPPRHPALQSQTHASLPAPAPCPSPLSPHPPRKKRHCAGRETLITISQQAAPSPRPTP